MINVWWTQLSREAMRMSANPQNILEYFVAMIVNISRILFNYGYYFIVFFILFFTVFFTVFRKSNKKR